MAVGSKAILRAVLIACGVGATLGGCAQEQPQSTVTRGLDSGVTSSNGGGMAPANFGTSAPIRTR